MKIIVIEKGYSGIKKKTKKKKNEIYVKIVEKS